ncbi:aldehyde dehydrogenase family protein [Streptomyces sp. NPDC048248]|uniref:aldehyde dehydrogenase family protein n=1 Tax=Streptomyces sp. NPDC048248 TaxID=3365523 RepID=UPI003713E1AF
MTARVRRNAEAVPSSAADLPPARHYIDGSFLDAPHERFTDVVDPCTEEVIARIPEGSAADVDRAVAAALSAQEQWARMVPSDRSALLHRIADLLAEHSDVLIRLEMANAGRPLAVARYDINGTIDTFRFMAGALRATTTMTAGEYAADHLSVILREPLGVVGVVAPWNYPLMMAARKLAPSLAAGNSVVIKPSEQTPLSTLKFAELIGDLLPAGVVNVVTGLGPTVGARLAEHPDIAMVALTGSVGSGRAVARTAADTLKRVHLALGGKAPVVVFEDADLKAAASALRVAGFWNSGQECGAGCRVLVHASVADRFVEHLVHEVGDIPEDAEVAREEVFGPVVTVETFTDEDEAVRRANDVSFGLAASVWTESARRSHSVAGRSDFGTVWVNSHLTLANEVPRGGFKGSGYGRGLSLDALDDYSRSKHVMHHHGR